MCSEVAAKSGESDMRLTGNLMRFTIPVNMSGIPAITLPVGQDSSGESAAALSMLLQMAVS